MRVTQAGTEFGRKRGSRSAGCLETLDECFEMIREKLSGSARSWMINELAEIQSPAARHLYILAKATRLARPAATRFDASSVPRAAKPRRPTRTAEFAVVPRTREGLMNIAGAVPTPLHKFPADIQRRFWRVGIV